MSRKSKLTPEERRARDLSLARLRNQRYWAKHRTRLNAEAREADAAKKAAMTPEEFTAYHAKEAAQAVQRYHANLEQGREKSRAWDAAHREERRAKAAERRKLFGPLLNARTKQWREEHPERYRVSFQKTNAKRREPARVYTRTYYWTHRDDILAKSKAQAGEPEHLAYKRAYRSVNHDKIRKQERTRYAKNPDTIIAGVKYRNSLKRGSAGGDYSAAQWREQQEVQHHRCYYCDKRCKGHLTQDHIIPVSKGGKHTASNIVGACRSCNASKRDKAPPIPVQMTLLTLAKPFKKKKIS